MDLEDQTIDLGTSIGIALHPLHGRDAGSLLNRAELAMYAAKRQRNSTAALRTARSTPAAQESLSLLSELRQAVGARELRLYLQPKVDLQTGQVVAAEALVRWQHPQRGLVLPGDFIPFAEQTGFIRQLTLWVIDAAARTAQKAQARGLDLRISVNLSARDLLDQDLPSEGRWRCCSTTARGRRRCASRSPRARSWTTRSARC